MFSVRKQRRIRGVTLRKLRASWLAKNAPPSKEKISLLGYLNQPIVIWLFSSLLIGVASFSYSNYNSCKINAYADDQKAQRYIMEAAERLEDFNVRFRAEFDSQLLIDVEKQFLDPAASYKYSEFKGFYTNQLSTEWIWLNIRWDMWHRDMTFPKVPKPMKESAFVEYSLSDDDEKELSFERKNEYIYNMFNQYAGIENQVKNAVISSDPIKRAEFNNKIMSGMSAAVSAADAAIQVAYHGYLSSSSWIRKAIWPF